jgi:hypothetical protein
VAFSVDGWSLLVVAPGGARLLALPDLATFAAFRPQPKDGLAPPLADGVFVGPGQQLALLPRGGNTYLTSPAPEDFAVVPNSAGTALEGDPLGQRLAVRYGERRIALFEATERRVFGRDDWPAPPRALALNPLEPAIATCGPGASRVWRAVAGLEGYNLPELVAVTYGPAGQLFGSDGKVVYALFPTLRLPLAPAFAADCLACAAVEPRLAGATAAGRLALWDLNARIEPPPAEPAPEAAAQELLATAKTAYADGLNAMRQEHYAEARAGFVKAREALAKLPAAGETPAVLCMAWLRSSQVSYLLKDWETSRAEAVELVKAAAGVTDAEQHTFYVAMGLYRQADALWEAGARDQARPLYQKSLDAGLTGPAADDAKAKVRP